MPRHHDHHLKSENKKTQTELEHLQESKKATDQAKAELLAHNSVLGNHPQAQQAVNEVIEAVENIAQEKVAEFSNYVNRAEDSYVKRAEDMERIAKNSAKVFSQQAEQAHSSSMEMISENLNQWFDLQNQMMGAMMKGWSDYMQATLSFMQDRKAS